MATHEGGLVGEMIGSSGDINLLEFKLLSAARSGEGNEQSSVLASEPEEFAANGLVNWGEESRRPSEDGTAYISDDGLEIVLVGRDDLFGGGRGEARSERRPRVKREERSGSVFALSRTD